TSSVFLVTGRSAFTTSGPMVILGTKCPSMTSTWIQSAPAASTARTSSPSLAKSADRIDGAIIKGRGIGGPPKRGSRNTLRRGGQCKPPLCPQFRGRLFGWKPERHEVGADHDIAGEAAVLRGLLEVGLLQGAAGN